MNLQQATAFVSEHSDDDDLDQSDIDDDGSCCEECGHPIDGSSGGAGDCNACDARSR